ncbi:MAG TPA: DUF3037 domain-containing protein [Pyrinomonadaceae bacterium]|nr:DUF3037 domain-containing protein [Pyrinomonadaceae bacterium]
MPERHSFDYAVVRVVPRVEREEFVNVGVVVFCRAARFLAARFHMDEQRLAALDPTLDPREVRKHLDSFEKVCAGGPDAGPIGRLAPRERFDWLVAPRSTVIQTSPVHTGLCADPEAALERLLDAMVRPPARV